MRLKEAAFKKLRYAWMDLHLRVGMAIQIRFLRKRRGWTRLQLAEASGVSLPTILRLEYGLWSGPLHTLTRIASAFDVAFVARFAAWSEVFPVPAAFAAESANNDSPL